MSQWLPGVKGDGQKTWRLSAKLVVATWGSEVIGPWGNALRHAVAAPPQAGKANAALLKLLASTLGVKRAAVEIVSGQVQPVKRIRVSGLTAEQARASLMDSLARDGGA